MLHVDVSRRWLVAGSHRLLSPPTRLSADAQCKTSAKADIVLLVDGSWSIGRLNFKTIRTFIARMIMVFDVSPDKVQIGNVSTPAPPAVALCLYCQLSFAPTPTVGSIIELPSALIYQSSYTDRQHATKVLFKSVFNMSKSHKK